jgi:hypothetical protein
MIRVAWSSIVTSVLAHGSTALLLAGVPFAAQSGADFRAQQATQLRYAGVYHLASGTWSRPAGPSAPFGLNDIYDNSCPTGAFLPQNQGWVLYDSGRIPGVDSVPPNVGACSGAAAYTVVGFQLAWCSQEPGPLSSPPGPGTDITIQFIDGYWISCSASPPPAVQTIVLNGLPGGGPNLAACWIADIDLQGSGQSFALASDGDGQFQNSVEMDSFAYSYEFTNSSTTSTTSFTGPVIAGDPAVCGFGSSTYYNSSWQTAGTGLSNEDKLRVEDQTGVHCFHLGGWPSPYAALHMRIYADPDACLGTEVGVAGCFGDGSAGPCPCGNFGSAGEGCIHSMGAVGGSLTGHGGTSFSADDLRLRAVHLPPQQFGLMFGGSSFGAFTCLLDGFI